MFGVVVVAGWLAMASLKATLLKPTLSNSLSHPHVKGVRILPILFLHPS